MSSAEDIRDREAQSSTNQTPTVATDSGDGDDGGGRSLPVPSISRKHAALIGLIVLTLVAWKLHQRRQSGSDGDSHDESETDSGDGNENAQVARPDSGREAIEIPENNTDPLAADEAIVEEFRKRGRLSEPEG